MKRALRTAVVFLLLLLCLTGCSKYTSRYNAVAFIHSNVSDSAFMRFMQFEGSMVFQLKCEAGDQLHYAGKLGSGSAKVYCDRDGTKALLFSVGAGEKIDASVGPFEKGTVYIIVETDAPCEEGDFQFDVSPGQKPLEESE